MHVFADLNADETLCNAQFGGFTEPPLHKVTENLVAKHIQASMKYLLIVSYS